jgi:feruloyl esterase
VGFFLKLPIQNWNGKFLELGCGGFCGGTPVAFEKLANAGSTGPLRRGYAVVTFDGGRATVVSASALWAYDNLPAQFDFGIRAPHVVALAGKAITERYYGLPPSKAYFCGCSTGGQQALSEAQRFPWDFNASRGLRRLRFQDP